MLSEPYLQWNILYYYQSDFFGKLFVSQLRSVFCGIQIWTYKAAVGAKYWVDQSCITNTAMVLSQVLSASVWPITLKRREMKSNGFPMSEREHLLLLLLLWNAMKHTYLIFYWHGSNYACVRFHKFFTNFVK